MTPKTNKIQLLKLGEFNVVKSTDNDCLVTFESGSNPFLVCLVFGSKVLVVSYFKNSFTLTHSSFQNSGVQKCLVF